MFIAELVSRILEQLTKYKIQVLDEIPAALENFRCRKIQ